MSDGEAELEEADGTEPDGDASFVRLLEKLHEEHGFDFRQYKEVSLLRRVQRRMAQVHVDSVEAYVRYLDAHPNEHTALFNVVLINVTRFFRDADAWTILRDRVVPDVIARGRDTHMLRFWTPGCSSGEEPYSLALLLADALRDDPAAWDVKIYGTDMDDDALATARAGLYRLDALKDLPSDVVERGFMRDGQAYRVRRDIRKWCIFGRHDLTRDAPLSSVDMLVCRNVLIYFDSRLQGRVLPQFEYAVRDGGYLFLGRSESLPTGSTRFEPFNPKWRIFRRASGTAGGKSVIVGGMRDEPALVTRSAAADAPLRPGAVLDLLASAVMVIDAADTIVVWNAAAETIFQIPADGALGKKFRDLDVSYRIDGLRARVEEIRSKQVHRRMDGVVFTRRSGDMLHLELTVDIVFDDRRRPCVVVIADDVSEYGLLREELDRVAEQSATANEELQSTNEELETTNEELQSTNEELETTNEELQSTNEELETTIEELQCVNSELGGLNAELERRGAELTRLDTLQHSVFAAIRTPLFVLDPEGRVTSWNDAAVTMWGVSSDIAVGRPFIALPIEEAMSADEPLRRVKQTRAADRIVLADTRRQDRPRRRVLDLTPISSPGGELLAILGLASDEAAAKG